GRAAAQARWGKKDKENKARDDARALPSQSERNANQKPEAREKKETRAGRAPSPGCDEFWFRYPNKVGKPAASKAFARAVKRTPLPEIMAGLERYAAKTDDRPWCNPATWLNQDRWADEPAPSGPAPPALVEPEAVWVKRLA